MAADTFEDDEDFNTPHLPERYHQIVRAKKQQRLKKRILMAVAAIIVIVVLYSLMSWAAGGLLSGMGSPSPAAQEPPATSPSVTTQPVPATTAPSVTLGAATTATIPQGVVPITPAINAERAREIADTYVIEQNHGSLPLNMSHSSYGPAASSTGSGAGQYTFVYERTYQDIPTDVDGFTVIVDAGTGEVIGYTHQWTTPEHAFLSATQVDIVRHEATFAVLQKAREIYPDQTDSIRIISADLRWMNDIPQGTVPRPGSIPVAWKVLFNDDVMRQSSAQPAVAWVDAHSGEFLAFEYRH